MSLALALAAPAVVYLLTHPLASALLAGLVAGRLSRPLARRVRAWVGRLRRSLTVPRPARFVATRGD